MPGVSRVTVIGRSMHDIAAVWGTLQSYFTSADLIVSEDPAGRALEGPGSADGVLFALLDRHADIEQLQALDVAPDWLFILCPRTLLQIWLAELTPLAAPVRPFEDADLALIARRAMASRHGQPSGREQL